MPVSGLTEQAHLVIQGRDIRGERSDEVVFYASVPATAVAGSIMFSVHLSVRTSVSETTLLCLCYECNISWMLGGNIWKKMAQAFTWTWRKKSYFDDQGRRSLWPNKTKSWIQMFSYGKISLKFPAGKNYEMMDFHIKGKDQIHIVLQRHFSGDYSVL